MSEPSSFFLHVHITDEKLEQFLLSPAKDIADYGDWITWFSEEERTYDDPVKILAALTGFNLGTSRENILAEHINFDKERQILMMDHIFLSESYEVIIPLTTCLRGLESYVTPATQNNFMIIYPYWWGETSQNLSPETNIYLEFSDGHSPGQDYETPQPARTVAR